MGQAQVPVDAVAGAAPLSHQAGRPHGLAAQADAHPGDVGHPPAGLLLPTQRPPVFAHATELDRFPLPAIEAKDPVRFLDGHPALQVTQAASRLGAGLHMGPVEGSG